MEGNKDFQRKEAGDLLKVSFTPERKFVCVSYPGIVQNVDKALATLGGIKAIQKVVHLTWYFTAGARNDSECPT